MPNTLRDFPGDRFRIDACCTYGHRGAVSCDGLPGAQRIDAMHARLRCSVCGGGDVSIRIAWVAAGGFRHSAGGSCPVPDP